MSNRNNTRENFRNFIYIIFSVIFGLSVYHLIEKIGSHAIGENFNIIPPYGSILYIVWSIVFFSIGACILIQFYLNEYVKRFRLKFKSNFVEIIFVILLSLLPIISYYFWRIICIRATFCQYSFQTGLNIVTFYIIPLKIYIFGMLALVCFYLCKRDTTKNGKIRWMINYLKNILDHNILYIMIIITLIAVLFFSTLYILDNFKSEKNVLEYEYDSCSGLIHNCNCNITDVKNDTYKNCNCKNTDNSWALYQECINSNNSNNY